MMGGLGTNSSPHKVCGPGSAYNRSLLHKAICEMDLAVIQKEVNGCPSEFFQRPDSAGFCPMHSACALCIKDAGNSSIASSIVRILINAGADASVPDSEGNTPLHWAARAGDKGTAELLLLRNSSKGTFDGNEIIGIPNAYHLIQSLQFAPLDAKNDRGETPLHWALRAGRVGMPVVSILLDNGAKPAVWSKEFLRPIDVAADGFDDEGSVFELKRLIRQKKRLSKDQRQQLKDIAEQRKEARAYLLQLSVQSRTLVLHHPECLEHIPKSSSDWECPDRVNSILDRVLGKSQTSTSPSIHEHEISISQDFERAKVELLSRVHSTEYLKFVNELSQDLERQHKEMNLDKDEAANEAGTTPIKPPVVPFTPMVSLKLYVL